MSPDPFNYIQGGKWEKLEKLPTDNFHHGQAGFTIGHTIYIGLGLPASEGINDFYAFDPDTYELVQKNNFPGPSRMGAFSFSYDGMGYMIGGQPEYDAYDNYTNDFWRYDPRDDTWSRLPDFEGEGRSYGITFQFGSKVYIGLGYGDSKWLNDFWEFDFSTGWWTRLYDFPGIARDGAGFFTIDGKGYVFGGFSDEEMLNDFWVFDPSDNSWTQKRSPDIISGRLNMISFSMNGYGYIAGGWDRNIFTDPRETFRYDPITDEWERRSNCYYPTNHHQLSLTYQDKAFVFPAGYNDSYYLFTDDQ